jgi:radical SAM superfamily enzyme YgiQ (UPF0313 family)
MKVLLIQPPIQDFYDTDIRLQPLGLCMLKTAAKRFVPEAEVTVLDFHQGHGRRTIPLPKDIAYMEAYYARPDLSPFAAFRNYFHFGAPFEAVGEQAASRKPDLVGISSLFTPYHREALACAEAVKKRLDVPVFMGGPHVSALPLSALQDGNVDFVVRGEGERPFVELLRAFRGDMPLERVPNLGYKEGGRFLLNPVKKNFDFTSLPFPDLSDLQANRYLFEKKPICFVTMSRGCPHRCAFCAVHATFGPDYRTRPPDHVLSELRQRYLEGYRVFDFEDDNLTFARDPFAGLLERVRREFSGKDVRLLAMNGVSFHSLDRELLRLMKESGFTNLNLSLVSCNGSTLARLNRPHRMEAFLRVVEVGCDLGFEIVSYQILGLPFESLADMADTMALLAGLPVRIGASVFYLAPGSPMAPPPREISERDMFRARSTAMAFEGAGVDRDDIFTLFVTARIVNFLKGLPVPGGTTTLRDALKLAEALGGRFGIGADLMKRMMKKGRLYAATKAGLVPVERFKTDVFFLVLGKARAVRTQKGGAIRL